MRLVRSARYNALVFTLFIFLFSFFNLICMHIVNISTHVHLLEIYCGHPYN